MTTNVSSAPSGCGRTSKAFSRSRWRPTATLPKPGRTAGGVVSLITRSGTNNFHGTAYEFFRNDALDARNVLETTGRKPELRQNQFGGSIGGPIFKDRTFFFGDYEGFRLVTGVTYLNTVPDQNAYDDINGINGGTPQALVNAGNGTANMPIDPVALNYLKLFPAPNLPGETNNFVLSPNETQSSNTFDVRVDHKFDSNNLLFARFDYNKVSTFTPPELGTVNGLQIAGNEYNFSGPSTDFANQWGIGFTHIFSPQLVLDTRAAYTRINNLSLPLNYGLGADQKVGLPGNMNFNAEADSLTPFTFNGFAGIGDGTYVPLQDIDNTFQYEGTVSYSLGNHQIRAGASYIRRQSRNLQSADCREPMALAWRRITYPATRLRRTSTCWRRPWWVPTTASAATTISILPTIVATSPASSRRTRGR